MDNEQFAKAGCFFYIEFANVECFLMQVVIGILQPLNFQTFQIRHS
jgi:hypothetical protein